MIGHADLFNGTNVTLTYDRFNNTNSSLGFDSGYIQVPTDVFFTVPFSISFWVYATPSFSLPDTPSTTTPLSNNETTDVTNYYFSESYNENETTVEMSTTTTPKIYFSSFFSLFEFNNAQNNFIIMNCFYLPQFKSFSPLLSISNTNGGLFSTNNADTSNWVHLAAVYDGKYGYVYVNGDVSQQKLKLTADLTANRTSNYFGRDHWVGKDDGINLYTYFEGMLDDIKIYNRALTEYEINALLLI